MYLAIVWGYGFVEARKWSFNNKHVEEKIEIAEKSLTFFERFYKVLFKVTSTRFGSGFVGVIVSFSAVYFFWVESLKEELDIKIEKQLDTDKQLSDCREEKSESYEKGRQYGKQEAEKAIEAAYNFAKRVSSDLAETNIKKSKDVEIAEKKVLQKRKELSK